MYTHICTYVALRPSAEDNEIEAKFAELRQQLVRAEEAI